MGKRKSYSASFKSKVALEAIAPQEAKLLGDPASRGT